MSLGLTGTLTALLLALLSIITNQPSHVAAAVTKSTAPVHGLYLTNGTFDGAHALTACTTGYHMASIWEIHEPSNLRYDTALGFNLADSGSGMPTGYGGWIRTGFVADTSSNVGTANCNVWRSGSAPDFGTTVVFEAGFNTGPPSSPLVGNTTSCSAPNMVWCVQD